MNENQKVYLRLKQHTKSTKCTIKINNKTYTLDKIFNTSQQEIFENVAQSLTQDFINGYNCTLLAYGQTGSGKTYTIQGTQHDAGIIQRALYYIFENTTFTDLKVSYVEIYNESIYDLFSFNFKQEIEIRENPAEGVFLDNLTYKMPKTYEETVDIFYEGVTQRRTAETRMNLESSRSHSIFTIYLESMANNVKRKSKFHIVDLAGSERVDLKYTEERVKESGNINKSLLYLGIVIEKLSSGENHINYRDSKLTYLLKDCLGGNSKLVVIGCIDYKEKSYDYREIENENNIRKNNEVIELKKYKSGNLYETINTLDFLQRVKSIKNRILVNSEVLGDAEDIKREYKILFDKYQSLMTKKIENFTDNEKVDLSVLKLKLSFVKQELEKTIEDYENLKIKFFNFVDNLYKKKIFEIERLKKTFAEINEKP